MDCSICYSHDYYYQIQLPCKHLICGGCLVELFKQTGGKKCPFCRKVLLDKKFLYSTESETQMFIGFLYYIGISTFFNEDEKLAIIFMEKAAKQKNIYAQEFLAHFYSSHGELHDFEKSMYWAKEAISRGSMIGKSIICYMYVSGHNINVNTILVKEYLHECYEKNMADSKTNLGLCYKKGLLDYPIDLQKAKELLLKATQEKTNCCNNFALAEVYESLGDFKSAYSHIRSIDNGCIEYKNCIYKIGYYTHHGLAGFTRNPKRAYFYYQRANTPKALYEMGIIRQETSIFQAKKYFKQAIKAGCLEACYNLAVLIESTNPKKAKKLYKKIDTTEAQYNLAVLYQKEEKYKKARKLYEKAADSYCNKSIYNLAELYEKGLGVKVNKDKAITLLKSIVSR